MFSKLLVQAVRSAAVSSTLSQATPVGVVDMGKPNHVGVDFRRVEIVHIVLLASDAGGHGGVRGVLVGPSRVTPPFW